MKTLQLKFSSNFPIKAFILLIAVFFTFNSSVSSTNVSGGIYSNTTWTLAGSPYIVTANVVVFPGVTLTIQPGVVVKFDNNTNIEIRQAQLLAVGTSVDSITFTSNSGSPTPGIYNGIYINGGTMPSRFSYCSFTYADSGVCSSSSDSLTVRNSYFGDNINGILDGAGIATLSNCNFIGNTTYGAYLRTLNSATINNCNFFYNGTGLWNVYFHSTVTNCVFEHNQTGLYPEYTHLTNCTITHNHTGINSSSENVYKNCRVDSNTVTGISANGDSVINCEVSYNSIGIQAAVSVIQNNNVEYNTTSNIRDNGGWGGSVITGDTIKYSPVGIDNIHEGYQITMNTIENNGIGINMLDNSSSTVSCNVLCNNTTYALRYTGVTNINVANNYWCTTDSLQTQPLIYDGHNNITYGLANFMPIDTVPCINYCNMTVSTTATNTVVCSSSSTTLMANVTDGYSYTVNWKPGNYTGMNYTVTPTANTTYTLVVTDTHGCIDSTTITIDTMYCAAGCSLQAYAYANNPYMTSCSSDTLLVTTYDTSASISSYVWQPGNYSGSSYVVSPAATTTYTVTVTDSHGCTYTSSATIYVSGSLAPPSICYVTADTASNHNIVVWSKVGIDTLAIDSMLIYRELTYNNYVQIGAVSVHAYTEFMDLTSHPTSQSYFYEIAEKDTCNTSSLSTNAETILLQSSRGFGTQVNLIWNLYVGNTVDYYRIMRDDSGTGNWHVIDSVPGNVGAYIDINAPSSPNLRYMLNTAWSLSCVPYLIYHKKNTSVNNNDARYRFNTTDESYSNITNIITSGVNQLITESDIDIYPNPVSSELTITMHQAIDGIVAITDVLGQNVYSGLISSANGATQRINVGNLSQGVYILKIVSNGQTLTKRLLKI